MPRPKDRTPQESRERIVQAATELFSQRGYSGAGVDELAARSGIAKTAIYYHFGSKEGLLAAVLERAATAWIEGIRAASQQAGSPLERLDRSLAGMRTMLEERPWILKLVQLLALEVGEHKPDVRATIQGIVLKARTAIVDGLHESLGMDVPDAEAIANMLLAMFDGIAFGRMLAPDLISLDDMFDEVRRVVMFMVATRIRPELLVWLHSQIEGGPQ